MPPGEDTGEGPAKGLTGGGRFVDDGTQGGPQGEEEVNGESEEEGRHSGQIEPSVQEGPGVDQEDEDPQGWCRQEGHEVVPHRQGQNEDHEDEEVVILPLPQVLPPVNGQP